MRINNPTYQWYCIYYFSLLNLSSCRAKFYEILNIFYLLKKNSKRNVIQIQYENLRDMKNCQRERRKISRTKFKFFKLKIENLATRLIILGYLIIIESKINLITWLDIINITDMNSTIENKLSNNTRILYTTFAYYHTTKETES